MFPRRCYHRMASGPVLDKTHRVNIVKVKGQGSVGWLLVLELHHDLSFDGAYILAPELAKPLTFKVRTNGRVVDVDPSIER